MRNRIDWGAVNNFDRTTVPPDLWHTARHEAAHLLTAAYYKIPVHGLYIKMPGSAKSPLVPNARGAVMAWDEPTVGDIVCTLAGTAADFHVMGAERCMEDAGFINDYLDAKDRIRSAVRDPWFHELYVSANHVLSEDEVHELTVKFGAEAKKIVDRHWDAIETLAAAIVVSAAHSTGRLHSRKAWEIYEYACRAIAG
ncbi:MAG: hypothetical protein K0M39_14770 [Rhizobium sp.]|nr:hypothetical protein [Rhizobium sp.]